ncbi:MAG: type II toxin-antitoxin system PemK/MazF family toxin [Phycisphaerales bacterium]|nr:type II toxin-antitoxin system PemK/MazF family toxin [Phycisphaerales bacterium]
MPNPRQGEVYWADLPHPVGRRPVLILTRSFAIPQLSNVTVAPLTRSRRGIQSEVDLTPDDGVPTDCSVSLDNIMTVPRSMLDSRIARLGEHRMRAVFDAIQFAFEMGA